MSTPLGDGHIIFAFSSVRRHTWFPVFLRKSIYPIFAKFGMGVYWVNSLHGIVFGEDSSKADWGVDILFLVFPPSVITLGFLSFQGKIFILSLPNLVWVFIRLIACMGLLLVKIAL